MSVKEEEEEEEYDKFGDKLEVQFPSQSGVSMCQVSGWDDDAEGIEEERNPFGMLIVLCESNIYCHLPVT
jgi:hypothetical protein